MAASVLLGSADGSRLHFSPGGGGGCENAAVGTSNGLGPPGPAPWNRSVDRALEEATVTGCLNLSGRKLKEFPRSSATHDLTDTTRAGKNRRRADQRPLTVPSQETRGGLWTGVRQKFGSKLPGSGADGRSGRPVLGEVLTPSSDFPDPVPSAEGAQRDRTARVSEGGVRVQLDRTFRGMDAFGGGGARPLELATCQGAAGTGRAGGAGPRLGLDRNRGARGKRNKPCLVSIAVTVDVVKPRPPRDGAPLRATKQTRQEPNSPAPVLSFNPIETPSTGSTKKLP